jgi:microcystin degradation protein MlrC
MLTKDGTLRVGIVMIYHESNTFVNDPITIDSFRKDTLLTGSSIRDHFAVSHHELGGFFVGLEQGGIEAVPLLAARIIPGGVVTSTAYDHLLRLLDEQLEEAGDLDGILAAPHGASVCETAPDMDGKWLTWLRSRMGPDTPLICTLDPHASLSARMVEATNAIVAYRTYPHMDQYDRGLDSAGLMARTLRREVRPVQRACHPPLVINIERQITAEHPCRALCEKAHAVRARSGVLAVSVVLGFAYADVHEMGTSFVVTTDDDADLAQDCADELGDFLWRYRASYVPRMIGVRNAVQSVPEAEKPVLLLDLGDNIGCATPGDGTLIAHELMRRQENWNRAFVCLNDPESVELARHAGEGAELSMRLGGRHISPYGPPLEGDFTVVGLHEGRFREPDPRHSAFTEYDMGPTAVVESASGLTVMLTSVATMPFSLRQLTSCGIDPNQYDVFVAKGAQAPIAAYGEVCRTTIRVNTPGASTADIETLAYHHRRRPMFPFEPDAIFRPAEPRIP